MNYFYFNIKTYILRYAALTIFIIFYFLSCNLKNNLDGLYKGYLFLPTDSVNKSFFEKQFASIEKIGDSLLINVYENEKSNQLKYNIKGSVKDDMYYFSIDTLSFKGTLTKKSDTLYFSELSNKKFSYVGLFSSTNNKNIDTLALQMIEDKVFDSIITRMDLLTFEEKRHFLNSLVYKKLPNQLVQITTHPSVSGNVESDLKNSTFYLLDFLALNNKNKFQLPSFNKEITNSLSDFEHINHNTPLVLRIIPYKIYQYSGNRFSDGGLSRQDVGAAYNYGNYGGSFTRFICQFYYFDIKLKQLVETIMGFTYDENSKIQMYSFYSEQSIDSYFDNNTLDKLKTLFLKNKDIIADYSIPFKSVNNKLQRVGYDDGCFKFYMDIQPIDISSISLYTGPMKESIKKFISKFYASLELTPELNEKQYNDGDVKFNLDSFNSCIDVHSIYSKDRVSNLTGDYHDHYNIKLIDINSIRSFNDKIYANTTVEYQIYELGTILVNEQLCLKLINSKPVLNSWLDLNVIKMSLSGYANLDKFKDSDFYQTMKSINK